MILLIVPGASVIRMCAGFLGEESFQRGLTRYLSKKLVYFTNPLISEHHNYPIT